MPVNSQSASIDKRCHRGPDLARRRSKSCGFPNSGRVSACSTPLFDTIARPLATRSFPTSPRRTDAPLVPNDGGIPSPVENSLLAEPVPNDPLYEGSGPSTPRRAIRPSAGRQCSLSWLRFPRVGDPELGFVSGNSIGRGGDGSAGGIGFVFSGESSRAGWLVFFRAAFGLMEMGWSFSGRDPRGRIRSIRTKPISIRRFDPVRSQFVRWALPTM